MKKKIAMLLVMMLYFFSLTTGINCTEVNADGVDIVTSDSSPSPRP